MSDESRSNRPLFSNKGRMRILAISARLSYRAGSAVPLVTLSMVSREDAEPLVGNACSCGSLSVQQNAEAEVHSSSFPGG